MADRNALYEAIEKKKWGRLTDALERLPIAQRDALVKTLLPPVLVRGAPGDVIKALISSDNINQKYDEVDSNTPLHLVMYHERWDLVPILLSRGADVNVENGSGDTALNMALFNGPADVCMRLVSAENVNQQDQQGVAPLHSAVMLKSWSAAVPVLIQHGADLNLADVKNMTPLFYAVERGAPTAVLEQLMTPQNVNMADSVRGETPLHRVVMCEKWDLVPTFIRNGADVSLLSTKGKLPPLHMAVLRHAPFDVVSQVVSPSIINLPFDKTIKKTVLFHAVVEKRLDLVQLFIQHGADVTARDCQHNTPLHHAVYYYTEEFERSVQYSESEDDGLKIVQQLITPQNINMPNANGETVLFMAMDRNLWDNVVPLLLQNGADLNVQNDRFSLWHIAVVRGAPERVFSHVNTSSNHNINMLDAGNCTPLARAVKSKRSDLVPILISNGADINLVNTEGRTFLHDAVWNHAPIDVIRWLFTTHTPSIDVQDKRGDTALHLAAITRRWDVVSFLITHGSDIDLVNKDSRTPLMVALISASPTANLVDIVDQLCSALNVNMQDNTGCTALHLVTLSQRWHLVPVLLQNGADVDISTFGMNACPLRLAIIMDFDNVPAEILSMLISPQNINEQLTSNGDSTPLHWAVFKRRWHLVSLFLQHGADINIVVHYNMSALYISAYRDDVPEHIFRSLISPDNINLQLTTDRRTPLHGTVKGAMWTLVRILISNGADINLCDSFGSTPLHLAIDPAVRAPPDILKQLISAQNISKPDSQGQTPLHLALGYGLNPLVPLLLDYGADPTKVSGFRPVMSLKHLCITTIRSQMPVKTTDAIETLGLPPCLMPAMKMIELGHQLIAWWNTEMKAEQASQD